MNRQFLTISAEAGERLASKSVLLLGLGAVGVEIGNSMYFAAAMIRVVRVAFSLLLMYWFVRFWLYRIVTILCVLNRLYTFV
jgi:hypothetical protein